MRGLLLKLPYQMALRSAAPVQMFPYVSMDQVNRGGAQMSEGKADPLQALVVDTQQISRDRLAELLQGKVWLDLQTATVHLVPEARTKMGARPAVLLALLGKK